MGFIRVPEEFWVLRYEKSPHGYKKLARSIKVEPINSKIEPIFIQPKLDPEINSIGFKEFSEMVSKYDDPMSKSLAEMLLRWSSEPGLVR